MGKCIWCEGTGKFEKPGDEEKYEELFDKFEDSGALSTLESMKRALKKVGYDVIECQYCKGTGRND